MNTRKLQITQLEARIALFEATRKLPNPPKGWVKAIRQALGISLEQLAAKLSVTKQSVHNIEKREKEGAVTLKTLKETARALDMDFVYGFVPKEGSLNQYIVNRARQLAQEIVSRTSNNMKLEDQENSKERLYAAIEERTNLIKEELPKALWD
jgi:predicted DNA-binding mobile mystery protein A